MAAQRRGCGASRKVNGIGGLSQRSKAFYAGNKEAYDQGQPVLSTPSNIITVDTDKGVLTVPAKDAEAVTTSDEAKEGSAHTEIQWLLLKLGNDLCLDLWVANNDRNKKFEGQRFSDLPRLK